jgi:hypothetical protein
MVISSSPSSTLSLPVSQSHLPPLPPSPLLSIVGCPSSRTPCWAESSTFRDIGTPYSLSPTLLRQHYFPPYLDAYRDVICSRSAIAGHFGMCACNHTLGVYCRNSVPNDTGRGSRGSNHDCGGWRRGPPPNDRGRDLASNLTKHSSSSRSTVLELVEMLGAKRLRKRKTPTKRSERHKWREKSRLIRDSQLGTSVEDGIHLLFPAFHSPRLDMELRLADK